MALGSIQIEEFNGNGLREQARPEIVIEEAFVDGAEATLSKEVRGRKGLRDELQLGEGEDVDVRSGERD